MLVGLLLVALPSFGWALHQATANPEFAYFDTFTRMFEFAVGALVAIVATRLDRMPQWLGASMAWVGLVMILPAGRFFTAEITWPRYNELLPTVELGRASWRERGCQNESIQVVAVTIKTKN